MITDTGHNEDGIKNVVANLKSSTYNQLHFVFGAVNDKDVSKIMFSLSAQIQYVSLHLICLSLK